MGYTQAFQILVTLTAVIKHLLPNFLGRAIVILTSQGVFEMLSQTLCLGKKNYNVGLKTLLQQGISEPEFNGDLVYKFRKKMWENLTFR